MDVHMRRPDRTTFRLRGATRGVPAAIAAPAATAAPAPTRALVGVVLRGLLVGGGVGVLLVAGSLGMASVAAIGVLALGAALMSWDR